MRFADLGIAPSRADELAAAATRLAALDGWANGDKPTQNQPDQGTDRQPGLVELLNERLLTSAQLDQLPPPVPLVENILTRNTLAAIYSRPGMGKTFVAMDLSLSVATGERWLGRTTSPGPVIYIAAEGTSGLAQRKHAWRAAHPFANPEDQIRWLPQAVNLLDADWAGALVQVVASHQPVLVVVDTLARSMPGGDENAPKDMSRLVDNADRIRKASGATVLLVHHSPKEGDTCWRRRCLHTGRRGSLRMARQESSIVAG